MLQCFTFFTNQPTFTWSKMCPFFKVLNHLLQKAYPGSPTSSVVWKLTLVWFCVCISMKHAIKTAVSLLPLPTRNPWKHLAMSKYYFGLHWPLSGKEPTCQCRRWSLIPGSERSPGEGNGNPLQHSCLGNPMDKGAWRATVHGVTKSQTWLSN